MDVTVLTAVTGAWEAPLVAALETSGTGVVVVRRCVDLPDLLASAAAGRALAVLLSADLQRLDRDAVGRLDAAGLAVVGLHEPGDLQQRDRLDALGVGTVLPADAGAREVADGVRDAVAARREAGDPPSRTRAGPASPLLPRQQVGDAADTAPSGTGRLVAVWGPAGAPGRTAVAVGLASEVALLGQEALLVDVDTWAASVAQTLAVLDEAPGVAAACRAASAGTLEPELLARLAPVVAPHLRVLTGINRPSRWPEVGGSALEGVWPVARVVASLVVADCGFSLEQDEELVFDTAAPRRNGATLVTLEQADVVLAVGSADPIGLQRLVRGLAQLRDAVPTVAPRVVVTRVRAAAVGGSPERRVREALERYAGVDDVTLVPDDRDAYDRALLQGRTLAEVAPQSRARAALQGLARELSAAVPGAGSGARRTGRGGS
ncbi:AAA family ATPase [Thalassiella azotivora]